MFFFFKQKTAYEMVMSDWSSDVCSSDLVAAGQVSSGTGLQRDRSVAGARARIVVTDTRSDRKSVV